MERIIVACTNGKELGEKLVKELGVATADYELRNFPDGETYFRIDSDVKGKEAIIVQGGYPNPNNALMEALICVSTSKELGAEKATLVFPYFPYARQDKVFKEGEAFSLKLAAKLLKDVGTDFIITADAHFKKDYGEYDFFGIPAVNISGGPLLAQHLKEKFSVEELNIISPDFGASEMINTTAKKTNSTPIILSKKRSGDYEVDINGELDVSGKHVLVLDDIISTGGTMARAITMAKDAGAEKVYAAATHGLFVGEAMSKLKVADHIVTTDSVINENSEVSLAGEIAGVLK